jgi:hypothetical protein
VPGGHNSKSTPAQSFGTLAATLFEITVKMKILLFSALVFFQTVCIAQDYRFKPMIAATMDTSTKMQVLDCCSRTCPDSITGIWIITPKEILILEKYFKKILTLETELCCGINNIDSLNSYAFQYLGVWRNSKKLIFINAFSKSILKYFPKSKKLNKYPMLWCDGGNDFWGALFDVEAKEFIFLAINGH